MGRVKDQQVTDRWALYCGDAMEVLPELASGSVHLAVYSPPFAYGDEGTGGAGLYKYSSSERDLSNAGGLAGFLEMYEFFVEELHRVTMPGRVNAVHCMDTPVGNSGGDALHDFPGDVIRLHQRLGFEFIARHVIWKEPLAVRNRTMVKDLTHKTIVEDCLSAGVASADQLLVFRKRGTSPVPVTHPRGFTAYHGAARPPADVLRYRGHPGNQIENRYSQWVWRQYASSVWDDIRGNLGQWDRRHVAAVLPHRQARDEEDEKHVHPLQLDVPRRVIDMRTNPGETVLTPYAGVGSELYAAVELGRKGIGSELKPSYYRQAVKNLAGLEAAQPSQGELDLSFEAPAPGR
ncbi:MAG TPA: DNA methyltransferase [Streptosporangiaceae bacterium]|nr:DNA methyltransferase [Streptosporangiaceae bacterium]